MRIREIFAELCVMFNEYSFFSGFDSLIPSIFFSYLSADYCELMFHLLLAQHWTRLYIYSPLSQV